LEEIKLQPFLRPSNFHEQDGDGLNYVIGECYSTWREFKDESGDVNHPPRSLGTNRTMPKLINFLLFERGLPWSDTREELAS
jgi:hypothetical protein